MSFYLEPAKHTWFIFYANSCQLNHFVLTAEWGDGDMYIWSEKVGNPLVYIFITMLDSDIVYRLLRMDKIHCSLAQELVERIICGVRLITDSVRFLNDVHSSNYLTSNFAMLRHVCCICLCI